MALLSVFSYDDLLEEIQKAHDQSRTDPIRASWANLMGVVAEITGEHSATDLDPSIDESPWWLTRASISGFRGVPPEGLIIEFPASPGITVIHGPNGSGKSSICDAVDVGLHQSINASIDRMQGTGGQLPVWEPVLAHSSSGGKVDVELRLVNADGRTLDIETHIAPDRSVSARAHVTSVAGERASVQLGEAWRSAVAAYGPTYAYASWEQHIQRAQDLQKYLARMLVLGGCFGSVDRAIKRKAATSEEAKERIDHAMRSARSALSRVAESSGRTWNFSMPTLLEDPDEWWAKSGFPQPGDDSVIPEGELKLEPLDAATSDAIRALSDLMEDATSNSGLAQALKMLDEATNFSTDLASCPVCGIESDWRPHLHATVGTNAAISAKIEVWARALEALTIETRKVLPKLITASSDDRRDSLSAADVKSELLLASQRTSGAAAKSTVAAAQSLLAVLDTHGYLAEAAEAVERASAESAWQRALANALAPLRDALREDRDLAVTQADWADMEKRLDDLESRLKRRRESALGEATNNTVVALLHDAGIEVQNLTVQKRQAELVLADSTGNRIELGMLSAGQRNAVLLAPALAVAEGGPFGFLLIDDPVHAFDELRVDFISRQIGRIAEERRVIVLTHDERLREHLLASPHDVDSRTIDRSTATGTIELLDSSPMWATLLEDAASLMSLANPPQLALKLTNVLRGLCRQALDNALRMFVTREAVRQSADARDWLRRIDADGVNTTAARFQAASSLGLSADSLSQLASSLSMVPKVTLTAWNAASHDNPPAKPFHLGEIEVARNACKELLR